jgi:putative DNA primase/helicase
MLKTAVLQEHGHLERKGHKEVKGHVQPNGHLFIPMRNFVTGNLVGGQEIFWDMDARVWDKKYVVGSQPKGAALRIGPEANVTDIILCEGYATGLSISKAVAQLHLNAAVLCCFNDSNMINITRSVRSLPMRACVFADNDKSEAGESAAQATGLPYCMSPTVGQDANDLHQKAEIFPVMNFIMDARKRAIKEAA